MRGGKNAWQRGLTDIKPQQQQQFPLCHKLCKSLIIIRTFMFWLRLMFGFLFTFFSATEKWFVWQLHREYWQKWWHLSRDFMCEVCARLWWSIKATPGCCLLTELTISSFLSGSLLQSHHLLSTGHFLIRCYSIGFLFFEGDLIQAETWCFLLRGRRMLLLIHHFIFTFRSTLSLFDFSAFVLSF